MTISTVVQQIEKRSPEGTSVTAGVIAYSRPGLFITYLSPVTSFIAVTPEDADIVAAGPELESGPALYVAEEVKPIAAEAYPAFAAIWDNDADDDYENL